MAHTLICKYGIRNNNYMRNVYLYIFFCICELARRIAEVVKMCPKPGKRNVVKCVYNIVRRVHVSAETDKLVVFFFNDLSSRYYEITGTQPELRYGVFFFFHNNMSVI